MEIIVTICPALCVNNFIFEYQKTDSLYILLDLAPNYRLVIIKSIFYTIHNVDTKSGSIGPAFPHHFYGK